MSDIERFLKAVKTTDLHYYPGACNWPAYLSTGELSYFTSKNAARDLMIDVDREKLKEDIVRIAIEKICDYYGSVLASTKTFNATVNEIVSNITRLRQLSNQVEAYNIISDYLLASSATIDTIEILNGNIKGDSKAVSVLSVNENVTSYLNELLTSQKSISNKEGTQEISEKREWLLKEQQYLQRIQALEKENAELKSQIYQITSGDESPKM